MVQKSIVEERFFYKDGKLFWKDGARAGKEAGWYCPKDGYTHINFSYQGKKYRMLRHRIVFLLHNGYLPDLIDHIDQNPSNDNVENLRAADKSMNALNTKPRTNNKTGHKGVWKDQRGKFQASVYHKGVKIYLGTYITLEEAVKRIEGWRWFRGV